MRSVLNCILNSELFKFGFSGFMGFSMTEDEMLIKLGRFRYFFCAFQWKYSGGFKVYLFCVVYVFYLIQIGFNNRSESIKFFNMYRFIYVLDFFKSN